MQSHPLIFCITFCISIGLIFFPLNPQYTFRSVPHTFNFTESAPKEVTDFEIGNYRFNPVTQRLAYTGTGAAPHADTEMELSHRESEILKRLCENRNQVVNTQNVLLDLWGDDSFFNSRSLHVFITKLRHKLAQDDRIRIVNVRGIGYKLIVNIN